jgi:poly(A) polymerase
MSDLTPAQQRQLGRLVARYPVADELGRRFTAAGHELYLVGGTVRDAFLERAQDDLDFATSAPPSETKRLVAGWADAIWLAGERFGTISAARTGWKLEITTFRADRYSPGSRHPDVRFAGDITTDLSRRDFTCNAMAVRLSDHRFVDPFGGLADLRSRVLRTPVAPEDSFADDPLRLVRMARFAAVLDAHPDDAARKATSTRSAGNASALSWTS